MLWPASAFLQRKGQARSSEAISPVTANFDTWGCGGFKSSSVPSAIKEGWRFLADRNSPFTESLLRTDAESGLPAGSSPVYWLLLVVLMAL